MTVTFSASNFRRIMESCGIVVAGKNENRKMLKRICLDIEHDICTAVGLDGYKLMRIIVPCESDDQSKYCIMVEPVKVPKDATQVQIHYDGNRIEIDFRKYSSSMGMIVQNTIEGNYVNYDNIIPKFTERETYTIAVNPKYMIDCMKAMKDCSSVVFHFGGPTQSIVITPNGLYDGTETGVLLPMRLFGSFDKT